MRVAIKKIERTIYLTRMTSNTFSIVSSTPKPQKFSVLFNQNSNKQAFKIRGQYFEHLKHQIERQNIHKETPLIQIKLKDGKIIQGNAYKTTSFQICRQISKKLAENTVVARVKYLNKGQNTKRFHNFDIEGHEASAKSEEFELVEMNSPLEGDCQIQFLSFEDEKGKQTFWHSSAHVLGQALENVFGAWLCHGPPLNNGFFYDSFIGAPTFSQANYDLLQKQAKKYISQKQKFERIIINKKQALELFKGNPYKQYLINTKIPDEGFTSAYRCGTLVDLCTGPHIGTTQKLKGFKITKNSSAYFLGHKQNDNLQRLYAISFPKQAQLDEYLKNQEEIAKRDHRIIGTKQRLFGFTNLSPGSALFLPHGTIIYNRLIQLMRSQYNIRGYKQVISPNLYNSQLWKMSGHYFKYKENIFFFKDGEEQQGLKPMNCPGHCLIFDQTQYSYRQLPIRMADFGVLHRNQLTGALSGLTRVRRFQQDDAHIFCRNDQIEEEILGVLDLLDYIYTVFGFKYVIQLATRPEKYLGELKDWEKAQEQLKQALKKFGKDFVINEGDGAFYGPKIDVKLFDAFGRQHQCGTVQLDFQLPLRFNLQYRSKDTSKDKKQDQQINLVKQNHEGCSHQNETQQSKYNKVKPLKNGFERPVIIHRAIFGSLQRFIAILCEHTGGKWDFWISPRQIKLLSVNQQFKQYTDKLYNTLMLKGYSVQKDTSQQNLGKKLRTAQMEGFSYMGIIGAEQVKEKSISIRGRQGSEVKKMSIQQLLQYFQKLGPPKSIKRRQVQQQSLN